ncbi:SDR family NAD(P)-dependent oxidoreductase [Nocardioides sp. B-3]|uniref:SDR family NAD(P)-dependent oxidoreductase n=1 Tax=Nocardioides sp. B-3 TaxID=2895565 RepID=UPI0021531B4A|nr:SDR family NAD(P)-dependent oxidoreductase [Nocardioides sp. B-3]UUZ59517.1 SDR family NAD(P)-dependent oxidoreductase [Nocardioides sp. B-3]
MRSVLITGGASGLGAALVRRFAADGWGVGVLDRRRELPDELADLHRRGALAFESADAADHGAYERLIDQMTERFDSVDALIANAAVWDYSLALMDMTPEQLDSGFDQLFSVNVKGYLVAAHAAAPVLAESGGAIVLTLSNAALYPGGGGPLYVASKHAGVGIVRQLAYELAPQVRVNAVAPAGMATALSGPPGLGQEDQRFDDAWDGAAFAERVPPGFVPDVEDYVEAFMYLVDSQKSRAVTGIVLPVELGLGVRGIRNVAGGVRRDLN